MTRHNEATQEEMLTLAKSYANCGEFGRKDMRKKYPYINFNELLAEIKNAPETVGEEIETSILSSAGMFQNESFWAMELRIAAWIYLIIGVNGSFLLMFIIGRQSESALLPFAVLIASLVLGVKSQIEVARFI
ncbi:MAG: hypothetical protein FWC70_08815 [Defluviitaleaceae bacterium]|nr:hypothetical protein [Defluviitaleaceae bacterium]